MFKLFVLIVILALGSFIAAPHIFLKYAVWDASNSTDDKSSYNELLHGLTPHIPAAIINQALDANADIHVIDVRTKEEYDSGHIKKAVNIPEESLYKEIPKKFPDKETVIYFYCDTGERGATATRLLRSMGYEKTFNLENGLQAWQRIGLPIEKPNPAYF